MNSNFIMDLHRLVNEYRANIDKAEAIHERFLGSPTKSLVREEIRTYKHTAELCGRIAGLYDFSDAQCAEWLRKQGDCERKLRELVYIHDHGLPNPAEEDETLIRERSTTKGSTQTDAKTGGKSASKSGGKSGKAPIDDVPQELVDSWRLQSPPNVTFEKNVAGMEELVAKLRECVRYVKSSRVNDYLEMGKVHSFFMYGPPGCGKTHVTNAFIHELMGDEYACLVLSGGDIHQSLVGMSEKVVERAFQEAKRLAPCILFIDEIESVCRNRNMPNLPAHVMNTTTAFLNGYNALSESEKPVIFIGATNYPNMVDSAMLDRVELLQVPLPDLAVREAAFKRALEKYLRNEPGFTYMDMAEETDNFSQRDLKRLIEKLKYAVVDELRQQHGEDGEAMVEAMKSDSYRLSRELFLETLKHYKPSAKEEHLRALDKWDADRSGDQ